MTAVKEISRNRVHGGQQIRLQHHSEVLQFGLAVRIDCRDGQAVGPIESRYYQLPKYELEIETSFGKANSDGFDLGPLCAISSLSRRK